MYNDRHSEVAIKYRVDDLPGASIFGSRLGNILKDLEIGKSISNLAQYFLIEKGLLALLSYAKKEITFIEFVRVAEPEQSKRRLITEAEAQKKLAEQKLKLAEQKLKDEKSKAAIQAKFRQIAEAKRQSKAAIQAKFIKIAEAERRGQKSVRLKQKYNLEEFIEEADFSKVMSILRKVDGGERLLKEELIWLLENEEYYTIELKKGYHKNEARFYANQYNKTKDYWSAINASSHYRKCGEARTADSMLKTIDAPGLKNKKLKSALFTTHGGVKRDLGQKNEALNLGEQAHLLTPQDFRPCTLLGAVNIEIGNFDLGHSWFNKAIERGYDENSMDDELRSIFMRADKSTKEALRDYLLTEDPFRYSWAKKKASNRQSQKSNKSNKKVKR